MAMQPEEVLTAAWLGSIVLQVSDDAMASPSTTHSQTVVRSSWTRATSARSGRRCGEPVDDNRLDDLYVPVGQRESEHGPARTEAVPLHVEHTSSVALFVEAQLPRLVVQVVDGYCAQPMMPCGGLLALLRRW
jgi:hypothetical protein